MNYRSLGNTGLNVSELAFGGVGIGLPYADQPMPAVDASISLLGKALDQGINFYDTARMYGESESLMGEAFGHRRDEVIIATKAAHFLNEDGSLPSADVIDAKIRRSLEESLKALQTEYIDVFMLHQANIQVLQSEPICRIFSSLKKEGLIRFSGASTYELEESRLCIESGVWDVIQMPANLLDQRHLKCLRLAEEYGVGVIIRSVLFRGMLTGRPLDLHPDLGDVKSHIEMIRKWNEGHYTDLLTLAVKFVLSYPGVSAALIGMDRPEHLEKAIEVTKAESLDKHTREVLEGMAFMNEEFLNLNHWITNGWITS